MILCKIEKNKLYFETDEIVDINRDIIYEFKLKAPMEISETVYKEIIYAATLSKAYFYLSRRDYSLKELQGKLKIKLFKHADIIERVVMKLEKTGYLNDYEYAKRYILSKKYGRKKIEYELYLRGISKEVISEIYSNESKDEKNEIRKILPKLKNKDENKKISYLMRQGFELDDILKELKNK